MPPGDIWQNLEMFVVVRIEEGRVVLLASLGLRPGMLLNIPQCTERPSEQRINWQKMSIVPRLRISSNNSTLLDAYGTKPNE